MTEIVGFLVFEPDHHQSFLSDHRWFKGPVVQGSEDELARIEAQDEHGGQPAPRRCRGRAVGRLRLLAARIDVWLRRVGGSCCTARSQAALRAARRG